jgi:hypothetical protein
MKDPCIDCKDKIIDKYGWYCDISCGQHTAWENHQAGIKEVGNWLQDKVAEQRFDEEFIISIEQINSLLKGELPNS